MAVAFKRSLGGGSVTGSSTTVACFLTGNIDVGDFIVVRVAADNLNATTPTFTCQDSSGASNVYTLQRQGAVNATAAAGVAGAIFTCKATAPVISGSTTITVTLSGAVAHKAMYAESFTGVDNTVRSAAVGATGTATAASAGASGTVNAGDLALGMIANETRGTITGDTDTTNGSWSTIFLQKSSTGGSDATCVTAAGQYKIATASGAQTYNVTAVAAEWLCQCVVMQASPEAAITQAAYQWFGEGTETGATALAAQDTAVVGNIVNGDATGTLRIRLQSTNAAAVPATDDWQLQYEKNLSGSWINVTAVTTAVATYDSPNLTNAAATTNRLTGGTGSFVAGKVSEDSLMDDLGWAGNNYTELVYALKVKAADVIDGDALRFRVLRNGATTTMTYAVTPTITIKGPVAVAGSSGGGSTTTSALTVVLPVLMTASASGVAATIAALTVSLPIVPALANTRALETTEQRNTEAGGPRALESAGGEVALAASTSGIATVTAAVGIGVPFAGSSAAISTTTSALARAVPMVATVGGLSTVTSAVAVARALSSTTGVGTSTTTSVLGVGRPLAAAAAGLSTTTSALTVALAPIVLVGAANGTSTVTAALARAVPMVAATGGGSTTTSAAAVARALVGATTGLSTTTSATVVARALAGSTAGLATTVSNATVGIGFASVAVGLSTAVATLSSTGDVFDPTLLTGLTVWVDASTLTPGDLIAWPNQGSAPDPAIVGTPAPVVVPGVLNGKPVVRFRPSAGRIRGTGMVAQDSFDVSVFYVARWDGPNLGRIFTNTYPPYNFLVGAHTSLDEWIYDNGAGNVTGIGWGAWPAPWKLYEAVCSETPKESRLFVNGVDKGYVTTSAGHDNRWNLSGYAETEETCDCSVAELVIYDRALTPAERVQVEEYLTDKWLYVPPPVEMVGASNGTSTAGSTSLVFARPLVVTAAGVSTAGASTLVRVLATTAAAGGLSTVTGALVLGRPLAAGVAGASSATGTLAVARSLAAATAGVSTVTAAAVRRAVPLASSTAGVSTTTSAMATADALVATVSGIATVTGALAVARALAANAAGVATTTATTLNSGAMSALTQASSTATGALRVARALAGSTSGITATGGALAKAVPLVGGAPTPVLPPVTGLTGRWDASLLALADGASVSAWPDQSAVSGTLIPVTSAPTYKTPVLNGMGVVRFATSAQPLLAAASASYKHFFVVAHFRLATFPTYNGLLTGIGGNDLILVGVGGQAYWYDHWGNAANYHFNGVIHTGGTDPPPMGGVFGIISISKDIAWGPLQLQIGLDRTNTDRWWDGDVAEVIAYDRVLSDSERIQVEQYLNAKWFVASGGPAAAGVSTTTSAVAVARRLVASSTGAATATASLSVAVSMTATSGGKMTPTAALARAVPMTAAVSGLSTAVSVSVAIDRAMVAAANGSSAATSAGVRVAYAMIASADGTSTATGDTPAVVLNMTASSNGVSATGGELGLVEQLFGMWNGEYFDAMQYGPYTVVDYLLVPPA